MLHHLAHSLSLSLTNTHTMSRQAAEKEKRWKGHVLVVPYPAQGHVNPMMHLSHRLAAHGLLVTFANAQFNHDRILRARAASPHIHTHDAHGSIRLVGIQDGLGHDDYVATFNVPKQFQALKGLEPVLVKLVEEIQPPVTCIIADFCVISTHAVAKRFNIPHVSLWTFSAASYVTHVFFTQNHASLKGYLEAICQEGKAEERIISCVPSCPTVSYKELMTFLQPCDPSDFIFSYICQAFQMAPQSKFVLINTFGELEEESFAYIHAPNILCIGLLLPPQYVLDTNSSSPLGPKRNIPSLGTSFWAEDSEGCLSWLHQQKPLSVLYVSFGSITPMSTHQVVELIAGLEASGCPFLMVVRPELVKGEDTSAFQNGFVDNMRKNGQAVFVAWAPQLEVLAHPAIGGFLTHAGWNSTLESICKGVPMLCWPYFADQMLNTRCIVDKWKIGLDFVTEKITINEKPRNSKHAHSDEIDNNVNKDGKSEEVAIVRSEEIEQKIRQLMDPSTSREIRNRITTLSLGAKRAYESSSSSNLRSLLEIISN